VSQPSGFQGPVSPPQSSPRLGEERGPLYAHDGQDSGHDPDGDPAARVLEVGGRLANGPSERLIRAAFRKELEEQAGLFDALGLADLAHTLVMMEAGIVPPAAGSALLAALLALRTRPADFVPDAARGDLYTNREAWLAERCAAVVWLGAGRARREATTTAFLMTLRMGLLDLASALAAAGEAITAKARQHRATLMPDYTYLQAAQPTTFGHFLLGFAYPLRRDAARLRSLYERVNRSPAGCGSTNGSRLPQDRERLRELLGFDGLVVHARDAMWQTDLPVETAAVLTSILINLDRLAEDLQILSTEEFALVELHDSHARASKIMPQKKNPFALTHIRGLANSMIGALTLSAAAGRTPSGQPDNRLPLYGSIPRAVEDTRQAVALMGEVVEFMRFDARRGRSLLADGSALATDLAEVLVLEGGLDFRQAHRLVGYLARQTRAEGGLNHITAELLAEAADAVLGDRVRLSEDVLRMALDPQAAIAARATTGGAAPEALDRLLEDCANDFAEARLWAGRHRQRLRTAEAALFETAHGFIST